MSIEFSNPFSGSQPIFSPCGSYIASVSGSRLTIIDVNNDSIEKVVNIYSCIDKIEKIQFSPDSLYILCGLFSRLAIQIFSIQDKEWKCRINEGVAGLIDCFWSPDSRNIFAESDFGLQFSIWSLINNSSTIISSPKSSFNNSISQLIAFSDCKSFFCVVHRLELQDYIAVYSYTQLTELNKFKSKSYDISYIRFIPEGTHIVTLDSPLYYKFCVYTPTGELIANFEAYQNALGLKSISFCENKSDFVIEQNDKDSSNNLFALGSFDGKVRILSIYSWQLAFVLPLIHPKDFDVSINTENFVMKVEASSMTSNESNGNDENSSKEKGVKKLINVKKSQNNETVFNLNNNNNSIETTCYINKNLKLLPKVTVDLNKFNSKPNSLPNIGVKWIGWSNDHYYLAARESTYPRCLWIWKPIEAKLIELIVQLESILSTEWKPYNVSDKSNILAFCTGTNRIYFWNSISGITYVDCINNNTSISIAITSISWNSIGNKLILKGKDSFLICEIDFNSEFVENNQEFPIN